VRNNREYDAITKEKELQELEIQLANKKIKEARIVVDQKQEMISKAENVKSERSKDLETKKEELNVIMEETAAEETKLMKSREKAIKSIEDRFYRSYSKIRKNSTNGLAVVKVKRGACGGCFNMVPPQRQADIRDLKKLIVCEHCGRVLSDVVFHEEPVKKKKVTRKKKATTKKKAEA
ncbi:MAG: putative nucleic acid-binding Zn-ribbon protein, partial [Bacteroidia bacterium]